MKIVGETDLERFVGV